MICNTRNILAGLSLALMSGYGHASLDQAQQALQGGNYRAALGMLETGARSERESPQGRLLQGLAQAGLQHYDAAQETLVALIAELPQRPEPYNNLAALYASQGRMEEARELLEQAMRTHPAYATVYDNLTRITVEMSRSSYARALRLQGSEGGMQLAALHGQDLPASTAPIQLAAVTPVVEVKPEAINVVEPEAKTESEAVVEAAVTPNPEVEPISVATPSVEVMQLAQAPATEEAAEVVEVVAEIGPDEAIRTVLQDWARDWAGQQVDAYLGAYSERFVPSGNLNLAQWQEQRRKRLARPERIEVELDEIEVLVFDAQRARVRLQQAYRSDRYSDLTRKEFQMVHEEGAWRIASERTIEVLKK